MIRCSRSFIRTALLSAMAWIAPCAKAQEEYGSVVYPTNLTDLSDSTSGMGLNDVDLEHPDLNAPELLMDETSGSFQFRNPDATSSPTLVSQPQVAFDTATLLGGDARRFRAEFLNDPRFASIGLDLYAPPDFEGGLLVFGRDVALKIGGYAKADFIYDFNPIDSTDSFVTTSIPIGAPPRTNARFHARQTRLSADARWLTNTRPVRMYVEGDFFGEDNNFRLRHAYGEVGWLLVGQTWTTFTDVAAAPATLDFEGSVSNVNRRQAQARLTQTLFHEDLKLALAVEDTRFIIETPVGITGAPRSPSPDFVSHLRWEPDWGQFQLAGLYRIGGIQPTGASAAVFGDKVITNSAWGLNFTGVVLLSDATKAYYQILYGEGIGSYRDLPDAAPTSADSIGLLPLFGWMVGATHQWHEGLSSNFTYAENELNTTVFQRPNDIQKTTYLAVNLIWTPLERLHVGIEYLYGIREDVDGGTGSANRLQSAVIFDLP